MSRRRQDECRVEMRDEDIARLKVIDLHPSFVKWGFKIGVLLGKIKRIETFDDSGISSNESEKEADRITAMYEKGSTVGSKREQDGGRCIIPKLKILQLVSFVCGDRRH